MPLPPGTRLGPYEIVSLVGAGGMGEVYRGNDTELKRAVAVKVLPDTVATDPERLARFRREAEVLASMNHANIAQIYGLEKTHGTIALVMELIEGPTLADRIAQGPVPLEEARSIARQLAGAIEAAHDHGIIHRDLKPGNIKIRPDGVVKVLDFGLAKALEPSAGSVDAGSSATITSPAMTRLGMILGTAAYMSPEQAKGSLVDRRSDIWAFGCVLYEMLTARRAFPGADVSETLADVLRSEPDWTRLPAATPPAIRRLLKRSLRKDPAERLQHIGDARLDLTVDDDAPADDLRTRPRAWNWPALAAAASIAALVTAAGLWLWQASRPSQPVRVSRFVVAMPPGDSVNGVVLSPDGSTLVYSATRDGIRRLYRRSLDTFDAVAISGTEGAELPFFSPDGEWLGFVADQKLMKVPLTGGSPITLCSVLSFEGGAWTEDGNVLFAAEDPARLAIVPAGGGEPRTLVTATGNQRFFRRPQLLPGGEAVIYDALELAGLGADYIGIASLRTGETRVLVAGGWHPVYARSGHLLFVRQGLLWAAPFDLERLSLSGDPTPTAIAVGQYALAADGTLVYIANPGQQTTVVLVARDGSITPLLNDGKTYRYPRLSPDGQKAVLVAESGGSGNDSDLWILELGRRTLSRLKTGGRNVDPAWSPDGTRIVYSHVDEHGERELYSQAADGSGVAEILLTRPGAQSQSAWSPDGDAVLFTDERATRGQGIWVLRRSAAEAVPFLDTDFVEVGPAFSPDGRWVAYTSTESGRGEVYVRPFAGPGGRVIVSTGGGREPAWARDGTELFYRTPDARTMMAATVTATGSEIAIGEPRALFAGAFSAPSDNRSYDVTDDGRFLMIQLPESDSAEVRVVQNWHEELKRLVPAR